MNFWSLRYFSKKIEDLAPESQIAFIICPVLVIKLILKYTAEEIGSRMVPLWTSESKESSLNRIGTACRASRSDRSMLSFWACGGAASRTGCWPDCTAFWADWWWVTGDWWYWLPTLKWSCYSPTWQKRTGWCGIKFLFLFSILIELTRLSFEVCKTELYEDLNLSVPTWHLWHLQRK